MHINVVKVLISVVVMGFVSCAHQSAELLHALTSAVGIYKNQEYAALFGLQKMVLISTVSTWDLSEESQKEYLVNWLCAREQLGQKAIIGVEFSEDAEESETFFVNDLKSKYPSTIIVGIHYNVSNFELQKLVKSLETNRIRSHLNSILLTREAIALGYDVVYSDTRALDVIDYFPYLSNFTRSPSDLLLVPIVERCEFPTQIFDFNPSKSNTDCHSKFYFMRSTVSSYMFLSNWYDGIIAGLYCSPWPIGVPLGAYPNLTFHRYCYPISGPASDISSSSSVIPLKVDSALSGANVPLRYCYMSEFMFQQVDTVDRCNGRDSFVNGMVCAHDHSQVNQSTILAPGVLFPVAEYESSLTKLRRARKTGGSWTCAKLDFSNTVFVDRTYISNFVQAAQFTYHQLSLLHQGSLIQFFSLPYIYVLDNRRLRMFPSMEVFLKLQFQWNDIRKHDKQIFIQFIKGTDVTLSDQIPRYMALPAKVAEVVVKVDPVVPPPIAKGPKYPDWVNLANKTYDAHRERLVKVVLARAAGVYRDKARSAANSLLRKTVLINVASDVKDNYGNSRYLMLLKNWFCYAEQYGYNPVTYWVPLDNTTDPHSMPPVLKEVGIRSTNLMSYPLHLFWTFLAAKKNDMMPNRANYDGDIPSFGNHGALVMLIPLLEALQAGFNILYFDLDTVMLRDPIPYMLKGHADFTVQHEIRNCLFPSSAYFWDEYDWDHIEPNTGIFLVRSTTTGVEFFENWLHTIVEQNILNDQKVLDFITMRAQITFSCNPTVAHLDNNTALMKKLSSLAKPNAPTFCYLNEIQFQNGKVAMGCARGIGGSKAEYIQELYISGGRDDVDAPVFDTSKHFSHHPGLDVLPRTWYNFTDTKPSTILPIMLHFNYCDDKLSEIMNINAWLPYSSYDPTVGRNVTMCRRLNVSETTFGQVDWARTLNDANTELFLAREQFVNGSIVKLHRKRHFHIVVNGEMREIPDYDTLKAMGYGNAKIKVIKLYNFLRFLRYGEPFPRINV